MRVANRHPGEVRPRLPRVTAQHGPKPRLVRGRKLYGTLRRSVKQLLQVTCVFSSTASSLLSGGGTGYIVAVSLGLESLDYTPQFGADGREEIFVTMEKGYTNGYIQALVAHGGMFTQAQAAKIARVSRQRISILVKEERLPLVKVKFDTGRGVVLLEELIPADGLTEWMDSPRKRGVKLGVRGSQPELLPVG